MKHHTKAFVRLKVEQQKILDFTVLTCHAMPSLSKTIAGINASIPQYGLAKPLYFNMEPTTRLSNLLTRYEDNLGKYIIFSSWSFFEFYFKDCMKELLTFYGGKERFIEGLKALNAQKISKNKSLFDKTKKLREDIKPGKNLKYSDALVKLQSEDYTFTNELFSTWGAIHFANIIAEGKFVSADIPDIMKNLFGFNMSDKVNTHGDLVNLDLEQTFMSMKTFRNQIGHGEIVNLPFSKVMAYNNFIRILSLKIDNYLIENFFILNFIK